MPSKFLVRDMVRMKGALSLSCLLGAGVAHVAMAQEAAEAPRVERAGPDAADEELAWLREVLARAEARGQMFKTDVAQTVEARRSEQTAAITATYSTTIDQLDRDTLRLRDSAIRRLSAFLDRHDDVRATSDVRLRLSELEFQRAQERWLEESQAYNEALVAAGDDLDALADLQEQGDPTIDLSGVVRHLTALIDANRGLPRGDQFPMLDVAYYMLAYVYYNPNATQFDKAYAQKVFQRLIDARPESPYADAAHLLRGRYIFSDLNDVEGSMPEFEAVIARGPEGDWFADAIYYRAWGRYKQSRYEEALQGFGELLDLSEQQEARTGRRSDYAPEAVTYIGLTLLEQADRMGVGLLDRVGGYFDSFEEAPAWRWDVYAQLGEALENYMRFDEAVEVYTFLQQDEAFRWRPENPRFQDKVVSILSRGFGADVAAAGQARIDMTERYGESSDWWSENRSNPEALATARRFIERYLLDVAVEFHVRAQEQAEPLLYAEAAERYREYLTRFPVSDNYFESQFFLGDSLLRAKDLRGAVSEFSSLVKNARHHDYADIAVYQLSRAWEALLRDEVGPFDQRAEGVAVDRVKELGGGETLTVYALLPEQRSFISAVDQALSWEYGPPPEGISDLRETVEKTGHQLAFLVAQVLFHANRFEEARPRLMAIIENHPRTVEASFAATLYVNSWIAERDYGEVRRWSREFSTRKLGPDATTDDAFFRSALEQSTYELGVQAYAEGSYATAAEAFLEFAEEFPRSEQVPDALISAASAYAELGRFEEANQIYVAFLDRFPRHEEAPRFYLLLAENFGATFQLDNAIRYYSALIDRFPQHRNAAIATYMVAFLKEGLGDHLGAAQGYEAYAQRFPNETDRESTHFRAGAQFELVSDTRAIQFYERYLRTYGVENPDNALEAQAKLAELYRQRGRTRDADRAENNLIALFDRAVREDRTIGPRARDLAAGAAFRSLEQKYQTFIPDNILSSNFERIAAFLFEGEGEQAIKEMLEEAEEIISTYASFEYTTAATYIKGAAAADYADIGYGVQPPESYTGPQLDAFWNLMEQTVTPLMDDYQRDAKALLERVIELGRRQKRHSEWVDRAQQRLNLIDPITYPAGKRPVVGSDFVEAPLSLPLRPELAPADAPQRKAP